MNLGKYPSPNSSCAWNWRWSRDSCFPSNKSNQKQTFCRSRACQPSIQSICFFEFHQASLTVTGKFTVITLHIKKTLWRWYLSLSLRCVRGSFYFLTVEILFFTMTPTERNLFLNSRPFELRYLNLNLEFRKRLIFNSPPEGLSS